MSSGSSSLATSELYDPVTRIWTATSTLTVPRVDHTASLLSDGKILIAEGRGGDTVEARGEAEIFHPLP
jgi:hypothetical protein